MVEYIKRRGWGVFVMALILVSFYSPLNAETGKDNFQFRLDSYTRFMPSRKVDAQSGKVELIGASGEYSYEFKVFDKLPVKVSLDNEYIGIEDSVSVDLPAHLVGIGTDIETTLPFFNFHETYFRLGIAPSYYSDDLEARSSAFRIPMRYFLIHRPNDKWTFIAGVAVYPDYEDEVWPILGFIYRPNEKLEFNLVPKSPNITYFLNDKLALFAEGGITSDEFEVTRNNVKNVVLCYKETRLASGIKYKINPHIKASLSAGGVFNRFLKYRDDQGKVHIKNGFYSEFRLGIDL